MTKLSTAAWVAHNLGLGACFGGTLFGKVALNTRVEGISSKPELGKVLSFAWNRYNVLNAASLVAAAGRSGGEASEDARKLVLAKDILFGTATGLASVASLVLSRQALEGATPTETDDKPAPETPEEAAGIFRVLSVLSNVNIVFIGAIIAASTLLAMESGRSTRWSAVSRFLP